jgi:1-acyl-sn-glycerol-3-phosphate acyltransferase
MFLDLTLTNTSFVGYALNYLCSVLFIILRFWLRLAMRLWYRQVYVHLDAPLPDDGAIIFASTHPNSAVDYLFAPLVHGVKTHVLVRGDVFENPVANWIFRSIYMLPVYRFRDGFASLNKNQDSFKACYHHFDRGGKVLIFSEGICIQEKTLQPLRKGTARLALDYIAKHGGSKVYIVPMATSYTRFRQFRSSAMVRFGSAIDAGAYAETYAQNANKAYELLTEDISVQLRQQFIEVPNYKDDAPIERALQFARLNRSIAVRPWLITEKSTFNEEKRWVTALTQLDTEKLKLTSELANDLKIDAADDGLLAAKVSPAFSLLRLIVLTPLILVSALTVLFPYVGCKLLINKLVKDIIFHNTIMVMAGTVFYVIQLAVLFFFGIFFWGWVGVLLPLMVLLFTQAGIDFIDDFMLDWRRWKHRKNFSTIKLQVMHLTELLNQSPLRKEVIQS